MFSPAYVRLVLNDIFEDAKALWLEPLMAIHYAHLVMLCEQGIVRPADGRAIREALDAIDLEAVRKVGYDGSCEDLFFYIDRLLAESCGEEVAGRLHTARSRNDIDMTMYRLRLREVLLDEIEALIALRRALLGVASAHRSTVFPAHTHAQPAQPTTLAHYLLGVIEQLERDTARISAAFRTVNYCPLGACAITGTGFPIDRARTSQLLGFTAPTGNTYGSIAAADYLLEAAGATAIALTGLGRFVQDLLLWSTAEVGYLRLPDGFVQSSSIMPQKRNPVALEHARAIASKAVVQLQGVLQAIHNTPFGDIVDTEDDLQPLVAVAFRDATRATALVAAAIAEAEFDVARMRTRATEGGITMTELADTLAREHGLSFKVGHAIAASLVRARTGRPDARVSVLVADAAARLGQDVQLTDEALQTILSPEHFIAVRRTDGGPAIERVQEAIAASEARLTADDERLMAERARGSCAAEERRAAAARIDDR